MKNIPSIAAIVMLLRVTLGNIICNGDFQNYTLNDTFSGQSYAFQDSNTSCWYAKNTDTWEVKKKTSPIASKVAELTSTNPYTLCQSVHITIGENYTLNFDFLSQKKMTNMLTTVKLDNKILTTLFISSQLTFSSKQVQFTAKKSISQICFSEQHTLDVFYWDGYVMGGCLDNVTLQLVEPITISNNSTNQNNTGNSTGNSAGNITQVTQNTNNTQNQTNTTNQTNITNQTNTNNESNVIEPSVPDEDSQFNYQIQQQFLLVINLTTQIDQLASVIYFKSDVPYYRQIEKYIQENVEIYFEGEIQRGIQIFSDENNNLAIQIEAQRSYDLQQVELYIPEGRVKFENIISVQFRIDGKQVFFRMLTEEEAKALEKIQEFSQVIATVVADVKKYLGSSICSYFILSVLNFWNLSLMYYFLPIKTMPAFTKNIFQMMLRFLFIKGSLLVWIQQWFNFDIGWNYDQSYIPESMEKWKYGYSWFGNFHISAKIITNNFQNSVMIFTLILKLLAIKLFLKLNPCNIKQKLQINVKYKIVLLSEIIIVSPFIIISSMTTISHNFQTFLGKVNQIGQFFLFFISVSLLPLFFIYGIKKSKKCNINDEEGMKLLIQRKQQQNENYCHVNEMLLNILIPFLVIIGSVEIFIVAISILLIYRIIFLISKRKKITKLHFVFGILINMVWTIHHFTTVLLFILELQLQSQLIQRELVLEISKYCGFVLLVTVLVGGTLEIIKFIIQLLQFIAFFFKMIHDLCKRPVYPFNLAENFETILKNEQQKLGKNGSKKQVAQQMSMKQEPAKQLKKVTRWDIKLIKTQKKNQSKENTQRPLTTKKIKIKKDRENVGTRLKIKT